MLKPFIARGIETLVLRDIADGLAVEDDVNSRRCGDDAAP